MPYLIEFIPGSAFVQRQCIKMTIIDDEVIEGKEQFSIQLTKDPLSPEGMVRFVQNTKTMVTIIDNEVSGIERCTMLRLAHNMMC